MRDIKGRKVLDLECSEDGRWAGAEVQVHNVVGLCLFSIPIRATEPVAA